MPSAGSKSENNKKIAHYRLDQLLVEQTVAAIYLAHDEKDDQSVFLVTLQANAAKSGDLVQRFQRRAETVAQLEHETLLPLLDYGLDDKRPFAVMAHLPGQFLATQLENPTANSDDSSDKSETVAALKLVRQLASGLSVAHPTGLIHHDLRPENIYLDDSGQPYLLDLVIPPTPPTASHINEPRTELDYQSPEQIAGKALSGRSNIYSLGILLYRLLAGQKPALPLSEWDIFEHKGVAREIPLNKVRTDLTAATYSVVQNCIWQKEWSRFETAEELVKALDPALAEESAPPLLPPPIWLRFFGWIRQRTILQLVIPAIILLFILLLAFFLMRGRVGRQRTMTPTPDTAVLPIEVDTADLTMPGNTPTTQPTAEATFPVEASASPTVLPSPTETAVPATVTEPRATATASPTTQPSERPISTATETSCTPSPPFGWVRYQIQASDSLSQLAQSSNTTVARLQEVNCLESVLISIGQGIWLPFAPTATPSATSPSATAVPTNNAAPPPPNPNPTTQPTLTVPAIPTIPTP
jgi:serine/threonine protein kinase